MDSAVEYVPSTSCSAKKEKEKHPWRQRGHLAFSPVRINTPTNQGTRAVTCLRVPATMHASVACRRDTPGTLPHFVMTFPGPRYALVGPRAPGSSRPSTFISAVVHTALAARHCRQPPPMYEPPSFSSSSNGFLASARVHARTHARAHSTYGACRRMLYVRGLPVSCRLGDYLSVHCFPALGQVAVQPSLA